jgi:(S)-2-hydroxyglutarate dehydrogenase
MAVDFDIGIVGGGIVGVATARAALRRNPSLRVAIFEKEDRLASHQTGRNSGVIHSGIYYRPGSAKAQLSRRGRTMLLELCEERGIAHERCGKVIVPTTPAEDAALDDLLERAGANDVDARIISGPELLEREPHVVHARRALLVGDTGIVDFVAVVDQLADDVRAAGGTVRLGTAVDRVVTRGDVAELTVGDESFRATLVINCAGLHSDVFTRGSSSERARIVPFRGEYYELAARSQDLVRGLIYPVPDPRYPFLGVHFTRMIHGGVHVGPNAVLALAREGYRWRDVDLRFLAEVARFRGTWAMARRHWRTGVHEVLRSLSKRRFVESCRALVPELNAEDLVRSPSGVRAQAVGVDGALFDDFVIIDGPVSVHVVNAPSPAATASLAIGEAICDMVADAHGAQISL